MAPRRAPEGPLTRNLGTMALVACRPDGIAVGHRCFAGGYIVEILEIATDRALVHYDGFNRQYDAWLPMEKISMPSGKRARRAPKRMDEEVQLAPPAPRPRLAEAVPARRPASGSDVQTPSPVSRSTEIALARGPASGCVVDVFDAREGWRCGVLGDALDAGLGTVVRFDDGAAAIVIPSDYDTGDVRRPRAQGAASNLEGRRVLVPCTIFGQTNRDGRGALYAGTVKRASGVRASIYFPIDGQEIPFAAEQARGWLVEGRSANEQWESRVPRTAPAGWPGDVLFCSFPLQHGVGAAVLKRLCALSECMAGVEIRKVGAGHLLAGTHFDLGLYATRDFRRGATLGQYAGLIQSADKHRRWRRDAEGHFDIDLDTADGLSSAQGLVLDAKHVGNEARIINDYHGIAAARNVRLKTCAHPGKGVWET